MTRARLPLVLASLALLAGATALALPDTGAADVAPVLALLLPGAALTELLGLRPGVLERGLYWVGASLSVTILSGLLLDRTSWGLTRTSFAVTLAGFTVVTALASIPLAAGEHERTGQSVNLRSRSAVAIVLLASCLVVAGAYVVAVHASQTQRFQGFTQFGAAAVSSKPSEVKVTVANREHGPRRYQLRLESGGTARNITTLSLSAGGEWSRTIAIPELCGTSSSVRMLLYVSGRKAPYRSLTLATSGVPRACPPKTAP